MRFPSKNLDLLAVLLAAAFAFNIANAVYYYSIYAVISGIAIIIVSLVAWLIYMPKAKRAMPASFLAMAFAEVVNMVPDLSFQYIKELYINQSYAAIMSILIITLALCAYFGHGKDKAHPEWKKLSKYAALTGVLFGLLALYSISIYSGNAYLNSQAFTGSIAFISEGVLLALFSLSISM